jgi:hypothetical protein
VKISGWRKYGVEIWRKYRNSGGMAIIGMAANGSAASAWRERMKWQQRK